ncbi:PAS domain-containing protein [Desulfurispirillum indicum]|uniref:PAS domain-containing protein n=1 Tax=Desulfurispirillum indicum TaxID=936456 RepID=UPI001CF99EF7|nr:PAS domain-containing protein [Desulfurispirillum indicum]UCZ56332.1 PAS domain-containing protein [Desulfurispirillum indicum]
MKYTVSSNEVKFLEFFTQSLLQAQCFYQMIVGVAGHESFTIIVRGAADDVKVYQQEVSYKDNPVSNAIQSVFETGKSAVVSATQNEQAFQILAFAFPQLHEKGFVLFDSKGYSEVFSQDTIAFLQNKAYSVGNLKGLLMSTFESYQSQINRMRRDAADFFFQSQGDKPECDEATAQLQEMQNILAVVKESRRKLYTLFDNISVGLCSIDPSLVIVNVNRYFARAIAGKDVKDLVGQSLSPYVNISQHMATISEVFASGEGRTTVVDEMGGHGSNRTFSVELFPISENDAIIEVGLLFKDITELMKTQKTFRDFQKFTQNKFKNLDSLQKEYSLLSEKYKALYSRYVSATKEFQEMSKRHQLLGVKYEQAVGLIEKGEQGKLMVEKLAEQKKRRELVLLLSRQKEMVENLLIERADVAKSFGEGYQRYLHQISLYLNRVDNMVSKSGLSSAQLEEVQEMTVEVRQQLERFTQLIAPVFEVVSDLRGKVQSFSRELHEFVQKYSREGAPEEEESSSGEYTYRALAPTQAPREAGSRDGIQMFVLS